MLITEEDYICEKWINGEITLDEYKESIMKFINSF